jgi:hypothetical protein
MKHRCFQVEKQILIERRPDIYSEFVEFVTCEVFMTYYIVAHCAPAAATVQVLGVNLLLTPTCHESWCP